MSTKNPPMEIMPGSLFLNPLPFFSCVSSPPLLFFCQTTSCNKQLNNQYVKLYTSYVHVQQRRRRRAEGEAVCFWLSIIICCLAVSRPVHYFHAVFSSSPSLCSALHTHTHTHPLLSLPPPPCQSGPSIGSEHLQDESEHSGDSILSIGCVLLLLLPAVGLNYCKNRGRVFFSPTK